MTEVNFTPGNWIVVPYGDGDQLVICSDDENWRIAFMATPGGSPGAMEKIRADANLLAASKDLYEALDRADWLLRAICGQDGNYPDEREIIAAARSALSKARGEP